MKKTASEVPGPKIEGGPFKKRERGGADMEHFEPSEAGVSGLRAVSRRMEGSGYAEFETLTAHRLAA